MSREFRVPRREGGADEVGERLLILPEQIIKPGLLAVVRLERRVLVIANHVQVMKGPRLAGVEEKLVDKQATLLDAVRPRTDPLHGNGSAVLRLENNAATRFARREPVVHLRQGIRTRGIFAIHRDAGAQVKTQRNLAPLPAFVFDGDRFRHGSLHGRHKGLRGEVKSLNPGLTDDAVRIPGVSDFPGRRRIGVEDAVIQE